MAILGTGTVVKRAVVVEDPQLGEVITVRSMVYLALTYDHRLVDGADAARFLATMKARLEEGAFEAELGLYRHDAAVRIAVTGSSGPDRHAPLVSALRQDGARGDQAGPPGARSAREFGLGPASAARRADPAALRGVDAVVTPGRGRRRRPPLDRRHKEKLRASRVRAPGRWPGAGRSGQPAVRCCCLGSALGWYGDTGGRAVDETSPAGTGFLAELVRDWEAAARPARDAGMRVVNLRTGLVLSRAGRHAGPDAAAVPARSGGTDRVWHPVHELDHAGRLVRRVRFLLDHPEFDGPVNLTAPEPVTNAVFTAALAAALHRPALLSVPAPALQLALGEVSSELLGSARVAAATATRRRVRVLAPRASPPRWPPNSLSGLWFTPGPLAQASTGGPGGWTGIRSRRPGFSARPGFSDPNRGIRHSGTRSPGSVVTIVPMVSRSSRRAPMHGQSGQGQLDQQRRQQAEP